MGLEGGIKTDVSIVPKKSQIFTISLLLISAFALFSAFAFLWTGKERWEIPLWCAALSGSVALLCWFFSHRNSELAGGAPTQLSADEKGLQFSFDPRNRPTKEMLLIFAEFAEAIAHRERLPKSSGLLDSEGVFIQGSEAEANLKIDRLNSIVEEKTSQMEALVKQLGSQTNPLPNIDVGAPNFTGEVLVNVSPAQGKPAA
ncbi:hypothetical protein [Pseudomonas syringae]|uniref:hypothetical protein n=1 Tax=Pseudomonas syringae TaxID=317 RepID=UPI0022489583|nr:hypothetical protein [Pseudomonas syringae]UZS65615.1 hypothetical protein OQB65_14565 [Pseudomonas syringae]